MSRIVRVGLNSLWAVAVGTVVVSNCIAAENDETKAADVKQRTVALTKALAKGEAATVANFWTDQGEYTSEAGTIRGKKEIEAAYEDFFETRPNLKVTVETHDVRFLASNTAVAEGRFRIKTQDNGTKSTDFSILYVEDEDQWSIALFRESSAVPTLEELAWLVGQWQAEGNGSSVTSTYQWDKSKSFLKMEYKTESDDGGETGSQMIGTDPVTGQPRSWLFAGGGGFGEGVWTKDGKRWVVHTSSQLPDGSESSATNILTPIDQDSFSWQSTNRRVAGELLPDTDVVTVKRVGSKR